MKPSLLIGMGMEWRDVFGDWGLEISVSDDTEDGTDTVWRQKHSGRYGSMDFNPLFFPPENPCFECAHDMITVIEHGFLRVETERRRAFASNKPFHGN
jgi:hypothetical protein